MQNIGFISHISLLVAIILILTDKEICIILWREKEMQAEELTKKKCNKKIEQYTN